MLQLVRLDWFEGRVGKRRWCYPVLGRDAGLCLLLHLLAMQGGSCP